MHTIPHFSSEFRFYSTSLLPLRVGIRTLLNGEVMQQAATKGSPGHGLGLLPLARGGECSGVSQMREYRFDRGRRDRGDNVYPRAVVRVEEGNLERRLGRFSSD